MLRKIEIERLALIRMEESLALYEAGHFSGAYYLGGYAVELALKACIAASFQRAAIPDKRFVEKVYTHDLKQLVGLAELEAARVAKANGDPVFAQNWERVSAWSESDRYRLVDESRARAFIDALEDRDHGVFEWIKAHW